jgi:hypothetical protein
VFLLGDSYAQRIAHERVFARRTLRAYMNDMRTLPKVIMLAAAAVMVLGALEAASAAPKKSRVQPSSSTSFEYDSDGVPIIMKGYSSKRTRSQRTPSIMVDEPGAGRVSDAPSRRAARSRPYSRGSSTYIPPPPPVPSSSSSSLPAPALVQPAPQVYQPPKINTFSDRATNAIHDFPLQRGIGNNPNDLQSFIRQRANQ